MGKAKVCGIGVNDVDFTVRNIPSYSCWVCMLKRCYSKLFQKAEPSYIGCSVCDEWLLFSNFKEWFDANYVDGYALDKDILVKGNRVYSPETCCFVPQRINSLLINRKSHRAKSGIIGTHKNGKRFLAVLKINGKLKNLGRYNTVEEAFSAYKSAKEAQIQEVAAEYYSKGLIDKKVYDALMNYRIEKTD